MARKRLYLQMNSRVRVFTAAAVIAAASAYVNHSRGLAHKYCRQPRGSRSSFPWQELAATPNNSFEDINKYNNRVQSSPPQRPLNIARFCAKVGCKAYEYDRTIEKLKRLKMELSNDMLAVEDELKRRILPEVVNDTRQQKPRKTWRIDNNDGISTPTLEERRKKLSDRALNIQNLLATLKVMEGTVLSSYPPFLPVGRIENTNVAPGGETPSTMGIENSISTRATIPLATASQFANANELAGRFLRIVRTEGIEGFAGKESASNVIKNLITTRTTTLFTTPSISTSTKEFANRFRRIVRAEGIDDFPGRETASKTCNKIKDLMNDVSRFSDWESLWQSSRQPEPPRRPPTMGQFMNQWQGNPTNSTITYIKDNDIDEECTREWFGRTRVATYPVSTSAASKRRSQIFGTIKTGTNPLFQFNNVGRNSSSTPGW